MVTKLSEVQMRYLKSRTFVVGLVLTLIAAVLLAATVDVQTGSNSFIDQGSGFRDASVVTHVPTVPLAFAATGIVLMAAAAARTRRRSN